MQQELQTPSTVANNTPFIFIRGMDNVIKKDLEKYKVLLDRSKIELVTYKESVSHLIKRKKYFHTLLGKGKYNDDSLQRSMDMIVIDLRAMSDKVKLSNDAIEHHTLIVDTLSQQLIDYQMNAMKSAAFKG